MFPELTIFFIKGGQGLLLRVPQAAASRPPKEACISQVQEAPHVVFTVWPGATGVSETAADGPLTSTCFVLTFFFLEHNRPPTSSSNC